MAKTGKLGRAAARDEGLLAESAFALARRWTGSAAGRFAGVPLAVLWLVLGYVGWEVVADPKSDTVEHVAIAAGFAFAGVLVVLLLVYAICLILAPVGQRDAARDRLRRIKNARDTYEISAESSSSLPDRETGVLSPITGTPQKGDLVRLRIKNLGRAAQFAALVESVDGVEGELDHPYQHLHWMGRPDVAVEEIPCGEGRDIGICYLLCTRWADGNKADELRLVFQGPSGTRYKREYEITAGSTVTINLIISARNIPEVGFTQPFSVTIQWAGTGHDVHIGIAKPDPSPRKYPRQDSFGELFNYT